MSHSAIDALVHSQLIETDTSVCGYTLINHNEIVASNVITKDNTLNLPDNALFQACSLSKPLTAYAILLLAAHKKIELDVAINLQLKAWNISNDKENTVTVRQCLNMTAGLAYSDGNTVYPEYKQTQAIPNVLEILNGIPPATNAAVQMVAPAGTAYRYVGAGYMVLQQLIEEISGQPFAYFMAEKVLQPLGMHNSYFDCPLPEKYHAQVIPGYDHLGNPLADGWYNITSLASGGLWSTPKDITKFMLTLSRAYLHGTTDLSQALAYEMLSPNAINSFGLGVMLNGAGNTFNFRKNGQNKGYYHQLIMFPQLGHGAVIMTNKAMNIEMVQQVLKFLAEQYAWPAFSDNFNELT